MAEDMVNYQTLTSYLASTNAWKKSLKTTFLNIFPSLLKDLIISHSLSQSLLIPKANNCILTKK